MLSAPSGAGNPKHCDRFDTWHAVHIHTIWAAGCEDLPRYPQCQVSGVVKLRMIHFGPWCHGSGGLCSGHCDWDIRYRHFTTMGHSRTDAGCVYLATHFRREVSDGEDEQEFPELTYPRPHSIWQQWHCHKPHQRTACYSGSKNGLHIKHSTGNIHLSHWSAMDGRSFAVAPGTNIIWGQPPVN